MKPFSTYPEDRAKLIELSKTVERCAKSSRGNDIYEFEKAAIELADLVKAILEDEQVAEDSNQKDADALDLLLTPRHIDEWHKDKGDVLLWTHPIAEAPHVGSPIQDAVKGWPGYYEWWTPLPTNAQVDLIQKRIDFVAKNRTNPT